MSARARSVTPQVERLAGRSQLSSRVRLLVRERFDAACAIDAPEQATGGDFYLCGGAIRRALLGDRLSGDLDIIIPNGDGRAINTLDELGVPFVLNSQRH